MGTLLYILLLMICFGIAAYYLAPAIFAYDKIVEVYGHGFRQFVLILFLSLIFTAIAVFLLFGIARNAQIYGGLFLYAPIVTVLTIIGLAKVIPGHGYASRVVKCSLYFTPILAVLSLFSFGLFDIHFWEIGKPNQ